MVNIAHFIQLVIQNEHNDVGNRIESTIPISDLLTSQHDYQQWISNDIITIVIEGEHVEWSELSQYPSNSNALVIFRKEYYLQCFHPTDDKTGKFIFFTLDDFKQWQADNPSPFDKSHPFNNNEFNIIWVNGIETEITGCRLSVMPINQTEPPQFTESSSYMPSDQEIRSHVHFVTDGSEVVIPERFYLPYRCHEIPELRYFIYQYETLLSITLIKEYYSNERIVISGVKRLTLSLQHNSDYTLATESQLEYLKEAVAWVYTERTETRSLLLMDRISLDIQDGGNFIPSVRSYIESALEQAKDRYEFVIKDRKDAHAKELSQLQNDIKSTTDNYSKTAGDIVSGLYKDVMSTILIFTIGIVSKLLGNDELLNSKIFEYLFFATALYLIVNIVLKVVISSIRLNLSLKDIKYWKSTTRNHMSKDDFDELILSRTKPYRNLYIYTAIIVVIIYIALATVVTKLPDILKSTIGEAETVDVVPEDIQDGIDKFEQDLDTRTTSDLNQQSIDRVERSSVINEESADEIEE